MKHVHSEGWYPPTRLYGVISHITVWIFLKSTSLLYINPMDRCFYPEDEGNKSLRNMCTYLRD